MTVTLSLNTEEEQQLRTAAEARGVDAETLLHVYLQRALSDEYVEPSQRLPRTLGLNVMGITSIDENFDAPLPETFWFGEE